MLKKLIRLARPGLLERKEAERLRRQEAELWRDLGKLGDRLPSKLPWEDTGAEVDTGVGATGAASSQSPSNVMERVEDILLERYLDIGTMVEHSKELKMAIKERRLPDSVNIWAQMAEDAWHHPDSFPRELRNSIAEVLRNLSNIRRELGEFNAE